MNKNGKTLYLFNFSAEVMIPHPQSRYRGCSHSGRCAEVGAWLRKEGLVALVSIYFAAVAALSCRIGGSELNL